jgi:hypothetical protein
MKSTATQINSLIDSFTIYQAAQTALYMDNIGKMNLSNEMKGDLLRKIKTCEAVIKLALASTKSDELIKIFEIYKRIILAQNIAKKELSADYLHTYELAIRLALRNLDKKTIND